MKILLLGKKVVKRNWGHELFRRELGRQHQVTFYGRGYIKGFDETLPVPRILDRVGPHDIILTHLYGTSRKFRGLGGVKNIPKVHIAVDYFAAKNRYPGSLRRLHAFFGENKYDLFFGVVSTVVNGLIQRGLTNKAFLLPFAVDTNLYVNHGYERPIDVMASYSDRGDLYPYRQQITAMLRRMKINSFTEKIIKGKYIDKINRSKMFVTSNNVYDSMSMKYTEVMACGTLLLAHKPEDFDLLGYKNGYHLVLFKDLNDLHDKILYFLKHDKEREGIAKNGMAFVQKKHSNIVRVKQFTEIVTRELLS